MVRTLTNTWPKKAASEMKNVDGTSGQHWTLEETTKVMDQNGVHANKYDWYYLMNMLHSDYSHLWGEDVAQYVKFAKAYINDPDAGAGKVFICGELENITTNKYCIK